jgi:hypothetical protein
MSFLENKTAAERKEYPIASGVLAYFPDALAEVAHVSYVGNVQHNGPNSPLRWDRSKSSDEADALIRHFTERGTVDTDNLLHSAKCAWRALAYLQKEIEARKQNITVRTIVGQKEILEYLGPTKRKGGAWLVQCTCGSDKKYVCSTQDLTLRKGCKYCTHRGDRLNRRKRPFEATYNTWTNRTKHKVDISYEQFVSLTKIKDCHYCGDTIRWADETKRKQSSASNLDRKDNNKHYTLDNVVVCCLRCNKAKNTHFTYEEWTLLGNMIRSWKKKEA